MRAAGFERSFAERDTASELEPWQQLHEEWSAAMYVWYSLLWSLIEGVRGRRIRLRGPFARDIRAIAEPLREGRNAVFHVGDQESYFDLRLFRIMENRDSVATIVRVHRGFARLLLEEMQSRRHDDVR